jgi:hypothetical protein
MEADRDAADNSRASCTAMLLIGSHYHQPLGTGVLSIVRHYRQHPALERPSACSSTLLRRMDPSTAAVWRDLYIGMMGAGASLTGPTFVATALDPHQIERTPLLRLRAASVLWCFVSVLFIGLAVLTPRPFTSVASVAVGVGGISGAVLLCVRTIRQRIFRQPHPGATVFRAAWYIFGFILAGVGGLSLIDVEQGWVFATLAPACVIMLSSGIFASWLLVLQIGVPANEKP